MFKISKKKEAVSESTGGKFIGSSGIYDVTIKFASGEVTKNGANQINFNVDYNGNSQTFYGTLVSNNNGSDNVIGQKLLNKLGIIAGMEDGEQPIVEQETHKVGKDNTPTEFSVITQFSNLPVKIRVQEEYSKYQGVIRERLVIQSFFSEDGASAEEIVNGEGAGTRLALEQEKYASNVTYQDGLTAEDVAAWKASKRSGSSAPAPKAAAPAKKLFGSK